MDYFSDQEGYYANQALPTPSDTPYHTPIPSNSRRSSRFGAASPQPSSTPTPSDNTKNKLDTASDESISILDPRRFTPTLHANLVSEILSLRRELDSKHKFIEGLETNLQTSKAESETLTQDLSQRKRENRGLKSQIQQLENGTLSALEQLAKEKDELTGSYDELRAKLETAQKRVKSQADDSDRVHKEWEKDREKWDKKERSYERRVHATETRLRIVLDELAAQQDLQVPHADSEVEDTTMDSGLGNDSDTASNYSRSASRTGSRISKHGRTTSSSSYISIGRSHRYSAATMGSAEGGTKGNGLTLADELNFDGEEEEEEEGEELEELELDSDDFPENEMRARRALESRQSNHQDEKAKRVLGLSNDPKSPTSDAMEGETSKSFDSATLRADSRTDSRNEFRSESRAGFRDEDETSMVNSIGPAPSRDSRDGWHRYRGTPSTVYEVESVDISLTKPQYVDTAVQYSPPPSPVKQSMSSERQDDNPVDETLTLNDVQEIEANQRRKRVTAGASTLSLKPSTEAVTEPPKETATMVSSSSQTRDQPPSPPATPKNEVVQAPPAKSTVIQTATIATQTDTIVVAEPVPKESPVLKRAPAPTPINVPSIVISPSFSVPSSPRQAVLPPNTRNVGVQASFITSAPMRSTSSQTDSVRSDIRLAKLPPHLLPSALRSKPGTPEPGEESQSKRPEIGRVSEKLLGRNPFLIADRNASAKVAHSADAQIENRYPGNNDNGFIAENNGEGIRRPFRSSSLFAGFTGGSSDEDDDHEGDISEDDGKTLIHSTPSRLAKHGRPFGTPPAPVLEENESASRAGSHELRRSGSRGTTSPRKSTEKPPKVSKPLQKFSLNRQSSMRRSAMIQSGSVAHLQRSRSPSLPNATLSGQPSIPKPPFPVPTRSSSRRIPMSKSEGSQSPTHRPTGKLSGRMGGLRKHAGQDSLRKVRSATVMPRGTRTRSRSPPISTQPSENAQIPPMPTDMVTSPSYTFSDQSFGHKTQKSTNTVLTGSGGSVGSSVQSSNVVDAIAATMVGEWMWKYVRKRKSFGVPESPMDVADDGGARHKRWVWLSPYERSVMWSSKQPTSGTALLGKSGRKLTIQSVLDVSDNTPTPKTPTGQPVFNRSILILTPARALKFTAISKERHYLWLTALSFLASSGTGQPEVEAPSAAQHPPAPQRAPPEPPVPQSAPPLRRGGIRDSVRLAKAKHHPAVHHGSGHAEPIPEYPYLVEGSSVVKSATPPNIPRRGHGRKRSSTGPQLPPPPINTSFRNFSAAQMPQIHSAGLQSNASSDYYGAPSAPASTYYTPSVVTSVRPSEPSISAPSNFFDAMGTVRMEAFVAEMTKPGEENNMAPGTWGAGRQSIGRQRGSSQFSNSTNEGYRMLAELGYDPEDPFKGF